MATSTQVPIFNSDPNIQAQAALIQQRQALAQKLLEEGLKPIETNNRTVGGVGYRVSPMEGLAKMVQAYVGRKGMSDTTQEQAGLAAQAYAAALKANQPGGGTASYSPDQVSSAMDSAIPQSPGGGPPSPQDIAKALGGQAPANQPPANPRNPLGMPAELITGYQAGMIPKEVYESQAALYKPTDATLQARQGGVDPMAANQAALAKANTDPTILAMRQARIPENLIQQAVLAKVQKDSEIERKAGNQFVNGFTGASGIVPKIPEGANPVGAIAPNGSLPQGVAPIPGVTPVIERNAEAQSGGAASGGIHNVTLPDGSVVPMRGSRAAPKGNVQPDSDQVAIYSQEMKAAQQRLADAKTPDERTRAQNDINGLSRETQRLGIRLGQSTADKVGTTAQATELQKRFTDLQNQNSQAQTTNSYLRNIKDLATTAATGRFSDRLQYVNALLSTVGNEKATDATTANDLLGKYNNQIVARLGQGGLGTDAARSILQSAYPNSKMTKEAIHEAADNLIGANDMLMAKARVLSPHGNSRDAVSYQKAEQVFDQNADPRMWQYASIQDPKARQSFLQRVIKTDPTFLQKAERLHGIGAL